MLAVIIIARDPCQTVLSDRPVIPIDDREE